MSLKELAPDDRDRLATGIRVRAAAWAIGWADAAEIDVLNILEATLLAMRRALLGLPVAPRHVCVDGNRCPGRAHLGLECELEAIVGGDALVCEISAASILAKSFPVLVQLSSLPSTTSLHKNTLMIRRREKSLAMRGATTITM